MKKTPKLRFPEFSGEWEEKKLSSLFDKIRNSVDVEENKKYKQIGIRSHGKGIFYKDEVTGKELGNKRVFWVEPDVFVVNIVFAWEMAVARTTKNEIGMIASHRFPMYKPKEGLLDLDFITYLFKTKKGKALLELASPGGAGRNKTLGQKEFDNLDIIIPKIEEQKKIASVLLILDKKIEMQLKKVEAFEEYKKGMLKKIFSKQIRFKMEDGQEYSKWEDKLLSDILIERNEKNTGSLRICSVAVKKGIIDQVEHLGRSFAAKDTSNYSLVKYGDVIYTKSPTGDFLYGIVKQSLIKEDVVVSPLYGVFRPINFSIANILHHYFSYRESANNYLYSIVQKGAKNTINISNSTFLSKSLNLPIDEQEQFKISSFIQKIEERLTKEKDKFEALNQWKKSLLQQMLV